MPEFTVAGLGQTGIESVEHAGQLQSLQRCPQAGIMNSHSKFLRLKATATEQEWIGGGLGAAFGVERVRAT